LLAHTKYLTRRRHAHEDLALRAVRWTATDSAASFDAPAGGSGLGSWFDFASPRRRNRTRWAWASWIAAALILLVLGAIVAPLVIVAVHSAGTAIFRELGRIFGG
jgi:hypothetical protein